MAKKVVSVSGVFVVPLLAINVFFMVTARASSDTAAELWQAGQYAEVGDYEQAEAIYEAIIADYPGTGDAFTAQEKLTCLYVLWGRQADAEAAFRELVNKYSGHDGAAKAVDHVADAYRKIENFQKARQCNQYIVDHWSDADYAAEAQAGVVRASILMGDEIGAQAAMNKLLSSFVDGTHIAKAVDDVADDYDKAGQYEKALQWHQYVVDHWPGDERALEAQKGVVISNIALGNQVAAQAAVDKLISDFKINAKEIAEAIDNVADEFRHNKMGKYTTAKQLYQYISTSWPTADYAVEAQSDVVRCSVLLGDEAGARSAIDKLLADFGGRTNVANEIVDIANQYRILDMFDKALPLHEYILSHWPESNSAVDSQMSAVISNIGLGDDPKAQAAYDDMLASFGDDPQLLKSMLFFAKAYTMRGAALSNSSDLVGADQCYRKGLAIWEKILNDFPPTSYTPEVCCSMGRCHRELGEYQESIDFYQKVVDYYPDYPFAWHALFMVGRTYESLGESGFIYESEAKAKTEHAYKQLLEKYPDCKAARIARSWLSRHKSE
jgi:tetratricopeptide (TPR) repeat protein